jgi:ADP-ribose pyrophosphatase YjhB (NUDIX family)
MTSKKRLVASALIPDDQGSIFVQRRMRRLLPGCWDLIGGHVEDDEDVLSALRRVRFRRRTTLVGLRSDPIHASTLGNIAEQSSGAGSSAAHRDRS